MKTQIMVLLTEQEISKHNTEEDCWIIVHGKVYNVSAYLDDHPGGVEIVVDLAGQDATDEYDDTGHSDEANAILAEYYIGNFNEDSDDPNKSATSPAPGPKKATIEKYKVKEEPNYMLYAGVIAVVAVVGFLATRKR